MAEIIATFADGRLLVQEEKAIETHYISGGVPFRIGLLKTVEKVLSIDAHVSGHPEYAFVVSLKEVLVSGDTIMPVLRLGILSGMTAMSGSYHGLAGTLSGIFLSGSGPTDQLTSACLTSGQINIVANVIGF